MHAVWLWILHYTGSDDEAGPWYGFWSGFGSDIVEFTLFGSAVAAWKHHQCHRKGCWRLGHLDPKHGFPACRRHHSRGHLVGHDYSDLSDGFK